MLSFMIAFVGGVVIGDLIVDKGRWTFAVWAWSVGLYRRLRHGRYGW